MVDSLIYYGLSWNTSSLPGNPYINFVICGLVELPGYLLCIPLMECYGRRISLFAFLFISGISCIISGFTKQGCSDKVSHSGVIVSLCDNFSLCHTRLYIPGQNVHRRRQCNHL